ncbi:MAG: hypothetical protein ACRDD7_16480 [Peptostreptococcaceae bacterium]
MKVDKYEKIVFGIMIAMSIGIVILLNIDFSGHKMKFEENKIKVYGNIINIEDVVNVELLEEVYIGGKIVGTNTISYLRGTFELENNTRGNVYVYNKSKPYIRLTTTEKIIIYNDKESIETKETYNKILEVCDIEGSEKLSKNTVIPSKSVYEKSERIAPFILCITMQLICGCGMIIYCFKSKNPVHFWSGTIVRKDEISNIKAYNRANGIMWSAFTILTIVILIVDFIYKGREFGSFTPIIIIGVVGMMICYKFIYNKYKVK